MGALEIFSNKDARIRGDFKGEEGQGREGFVCPHEHTATLS